MCRVYEPRSTGSCPDRMLWLRTICICLGGGGGTYAGGVFVLADFEAVLLSAGFLDFGEDVLELVLFDFGFDGAVEDRDEG